MEQTHPSELTAGFYNTAGRDGYDAVAEMFSRNSCQVILPGFDLSDESQPDESRSSPEYGLAAMQAACRKHKTAVLGQNTLVCGAPRSFEQISMSLTGENAVACLFTYQRMGADFFSPEHFPRSMKFVCGLHEPARSLDDLPVEEDDEPAESLSGMNMQMQTA